MRTWPLTVRLRPARMLLVAYATMHCIVAFSFLLAGLSVWLCVLASLLGAVSLHHAMRSQRALSGAVLLLHADGRAEYRAPDGELFESMSSLRGVDGGRAVWLAWRVPGRWRGQSLMLVPDNLAQAQDWRRLRIWLRWLAASSEAVSLELSAPSDASRGV